MTKRKKIIVMAQPMTHPEVAAMVTVILIWLFQLISIPIINLNLAILIHQPGKESMYLCTLGLIKLFIAAMAYYINTLDGQSSGLGMCGSNYFKVGELF